MLFAYDFNCILNICKHEMMFWFIIIFIKYVVKYELHIALVFSQLSAYSFYVLGDCRWWKKRWVYSSIWSNLQCTLTKRTWSSLCSIRRACCIFGVKFSLEAIFACIFRSRFLQWYWIFYDHHIMLLFFYVLIFWG